MEEHLNSDLKEGGVREEKIEEKKPKIIFSQHMSKCYNVLAPHSPLPIQNQNT